MRFIFLLIIGISLTSISKAQIIKGAEVRTSGTFIDKVFRLYTSPQVTLRLKSEKTALSVGPGIMLSSKATASDERNPKLTGIFGSFQYFPLPKNEKLNFYFYDDLLLNRIVDRWNSLIWNTNTSSYQTYGYQNIEYLIHNHIGYGMEVKLASKFKLKQSVGAGVYFSDIHNTKSSPEAPPMQEENVSGYGNFGFSWGVNLSLLYHFN